MRFERLRALRFRIAEVRRAVGVARLGPALARGLAVREYLVTESLLSPSTVPALPGTVRVGPLRESDVPAARAMNPALSVDEVRRRWREGQSWTGWWVAGTLAHWRWDSPGPAHLSYLGRSARPLAGDLWVVEVFTRPDYRNRGLYSASTAHAFAAAHAAGYRRVIGLVASWNRPALHVMVDKWRRVPVGTIRETGIGPWRRMIVRGRVRADGAGAVFVPDPADPPLAGAAWAEPERHAPSG
jgi:GNAT superfamily N-acetyltransferase